MKIGVLGVGGGGSEFPMWPGGTGGGQSSVESAIYPDSDLWGEQILRHRLDLKLLNPSSLVLLHDR